MLPSCVDPRKVTAVAVGQDGEIVGQANGQGDPNACGQGG
jgi:hypothetical protein